MIVVTTALVPINGIYEQGLTTSPVHDVARKYDSFFRPSAKGKEFNK
jgi:hypothetical protein